MQRFYSCSHSPFFPDVYGGRRHLQPTSRCRRAPSTGLVNTRRFNSDLLTVKRQVTVWRAEVNPAGSKVRITNNTITWSEVCTAGACVRVCVCALRFVHELGPLAVDEGAQRQAVPPRRREVGDVDASVAPSLFLAPGEQPVGTNLRLCGVEMKRSVSGKTSVPS